MINLKSLTVDVTPSKISSWLECYRNLKNYADNEKSPLIDVIKSRDGTEIKIRLISGKESG